MPTPPRPVTLRTVSDPGQTLRDFRPFRRHLFSRLLLLVWCVWLLGNWFIHGALEGWVGGPSMRWVLISAIIGLMLVWPAIRLTDPTPHRGALLTLADGLAMLAVFQLIILRLILDWSDGWLVRTGWSLPRALLIDAVAVSWSLVTAMWIDLGRRCGPAGRTIAMALCVLGCFGGALLAGRESVTALALSPLQALWELSGNADLIDLDPRPLAARLGVLVGGCIAFWIIAAAALRPCASVTCPAPADA